MTLTKLIVDGFVQTLIVMVFGWGMTMLWRWLAKWLGF
jgi:hypothetical protein